jgi:hypothetical protein
LSGKSVTVILSMLIRRRLIAHSRKSFPAREYFRPSRASILKLRQSHAARKTTVLEECEHTLI